jgi:branched-chain amino acid transport system ATP-binding protein
LEFHVNQGKILSIIGPNGAGKTTLFNLLTEIFHPSRGEILFQNEPITSFPPHRIARRGIARTFQTTILFGELTVLDNLLLGYRTRMRSGLWDAILKTKRLRREEQESLERAEEIISFVGLGCTGETRPGTFPGKRRNAFPSLWRWPPGLNSCYWMNLPAA